MQKLFIVIAVLSLVGSAHLQSSTTTSSSSTSTSTSTPNGLPLNNNNGRPNTPLGSILNNNNNGNPLDLLGDLLGDNNNSKGGQVFPSSVSPSGSFLNNNNNNNSPLGGRLLGDLLGGNDGRPGGSLMNNNRRGQEEGLLELLRSIPRQGMEMIQGILNRMRNIMPAGRQQLQQLQQQGGRNPMDLMNQQSQQGLLNLPNPFANNQNGQGPQAPLGSLLPQNLQQTIPQLGQLTQGLQRGVNDAGNQISGILNNVLPNLNGARPINPSSASRATVNTQ